MFVYMAGLGVCVYICLQSALYYAVTKVELSTRHKNLRKLLGDLFRL